MDSLEPPSTEILFAFINFISSLVHCGRVFVLIGSLNEQLTLGYPLHRSIVCGDQLNGCRFISCGELVVFFMFIARTIQQEKNMLGVA